MDHVFSSFRNDSISYSNYLADNSNSNVISSLSNNNILAFTSSVDLLDTSDKLFTVYVYVVDLNLPYLPYKITSNEFNITAIEWDDKGTKLFVGDENGSIQIWSMKDYLINDWQLIHSYSFSGDRILSGIWFHKGIRLMINYHKKDLNVSYQEKFCFTKIGASVLQFGSKHTDGYLCITSSGFVYAHLFCSDGKQITDYDFLSDCRSKIQKLDISYMKDGNFLAIVSKGNSNMPLSCYKINVAINLHEKQKLKITCVPFTGFTMNCSLSNAQSYQAITHLRFIAKEAPEAVVVAAAGKSGSIIELWELREKTVTLHNSIQTLIQQNQQKNVSLNMMVWKMNSSTISSTYVSALATPHASLFETSPPLSYIIVAYKDKTIKCFYRENFQMLLSVNLSEALAQNITNSSINLYGPQNLIAGNTLLRNSLNPAKLSVIRDIQLTWSSCAMVAVDSFSQLYFFRLSPLIEPCTPMSLNYAQLMLEYSLISGNDYWDILISIKPSFVETLCERITDNFITKQPPSIQQKWFDNVLQLKASLYRCVNTSSSTNNSCKAGDYYTTKMLNAVSETIKRLIRTSREYQEDGPAEKLSALIQNKSNELHVLNVDKILLKLENKDFFVEHPVHQSFQHLLQWVCDLSLYLLASIPQQYNQNQHRLPGVGLIFDIKSLNSLRELLVIIRFWKLVNSTCLPNFIRMQDNLDVIALIFRLLSKIVSSPEKFDECLVDECCALPNQVLIPQMDLCPKSIGLASPALFNNTLPLIFKYGREPALMKYNIKVHTIDGATNCIGNRKMDVVRYIALGPDEEVSNNIRNCTRCSSASLIKSPMRCAAARAWDQQWVKKCFCGGYWRILSKSHSTTLP